MKTDDYKQELSISATLCRTNAKKIFLRSKKSASVPHVCFFVLNGEASALTFTQNFSWG
jgi:hypothetical protein